MSSFFNVIRSMEITPPPDPQLAFDPPLGVDFSPIKLPIPALENYEADREFRKKATLEVTKACGNMACSGICVPQTFKAYTSESIRFAEGAQVLCTSSYCPLDKPPEAGDREPHPSASPLPSLQEELPIPTTVI